MCSRFRVSVCVCVCVLSNYLRFANIALLLLRRKIHKWMNIEGAARQCAYCSWQVAIVISHVPLSLWCTPLTLFRISIPIYIPTSELDLMGRKGPVWRYRIYITQVRSANHSNGFNSTMDYPQKFRWFDTFANVMHIYIDIYVYISWLGESIGRWRIGIECIYVSLHRYSANAVDLFIPCT